MACSLACSGFIQNSYRHKNSDKPRRLFWTILGFNQVGEKWDLLLNDHKRCSGEVDPTLKQSLVLTVRSVLKVRQTVGIHCQWCQYSRACRLLRSLEEMRILSRWSFGNVASVTARWSLSWRNRPPPVAPGSSKCRAPFVPGLWPLASPAQCAVFRYRPA